MRMQDNQLPDRRHPMLQGRIICGHIPDFVELKSIQLYKVGIYYTLIINGHQIYILYYFILQKVVKSLYFSNMSPIHGDSWHGCPHLRRQRLQQGARCFATRGAQDLQRLAIGVTEMAQLCLGKMGREMGGDMEIWIEIYIYNIDIWRVYKTVYLIYI